METFSYIVLIFLSLVGYSVGAVGKAGKHKELKPQILDLILVVIIWTGTIYSRITLSINKWLLILIWGIISIIIGIVAVIPRKLSKEKSPKEKKPINASGIFFKRAWQRWQEFSKRMGSFHSRMILSFFFFLIVSPYGLAVKIFSDPLKIKNPSGKSYWILKRKTKIDIEQYKRQF